MRRSPRSQPSYSSFYQEQGAALGATGPAEVTADSGAHRGTLKGREGSPMGNKNSLLSQDINFKVASELLMKLSGKVMGCVWVGGRYCVCVCVCSGLEVMFFDSTLHTFTANLIIKKN